jgi:hypothetical protein
MVARRQFEGDTAYQHAPLTASDRAKYRDVNTFTELMQQFEISVDLVPGLPG